MAKELRYIRILEEHPSSCPRSIAVHVQAATMVAATKLVWSYPVTTLVAEVPATESVKVVAVTKSVSQ